MSLRKLRLYGYYTLLLIGLIFIGLSCKATKQLPIENEIIISLGSFGGFAGTFKEYRIRQGGLLFIKTKPNGVEKQLSSLNEKTILQLYSVLKDLSKEAETTYNPGNMTYFIKYHSEEKEPIEWVWGGGEQPNSRIQSMYRMLNKLCKNQEYPIR